jgi:hypothetical protein
MGTTEKVAQKIEQLKQAVDTAKEKLEKETSNRNDLFTQQSIADAKRNDCKNEVSVCKSLSEATKIFFEGYSGTEASFSQLSVAIEKELLLFEQWHQHILALTETSIKATEHALALNNTVVKQKSLNKLVSDTVVAVANKTATDAQNAQQLLLNLLPHAMATLNSFSELKYAFWECQLLVANWKSAAKGKNTSLQKAVEEVCNTAGINEEKAQELYATTLVAYERNNKEIARLSAELQISIASLNGANSALGK